MDRNWKLYSEETPFWEKEEKAVKKKPNFFVSFIIVIVLVIALTVVGTVYALGNVGDKTSSTAQNAMSTEVSHPTYYLNTYRMKFHRTTCSSVQEMNPENRQAFYGTREEAIKKGYSPCHNCNP